MTYYLPIKSTSLAHYFACACVKPAKYYINKPQDIQDRYPNDLLISTKLGTKDTDCCLELVLTEAEEDLLVQCSNAFWLFPMPLPISRVKKVYFRDERQLEHTLSNINISAAFVPHGLAKVSRFSPVQMPVGKDVESKVEKDWATQVEMFDRILGALALMKTAREPYMNYSENYASTLSFFNVAVKDELNSHGCQINDKFFDLFTRSGKFVKNIKYLEKKLSTEDIEQIAAENKQKITRSISGLIKLDDLEKMTYAFAVLYSYGVGVEATSKKIDTLIASNFRTLKEGMEEGIALYYGYNRGYSVFRNSYGSDETKIQTVKYQLDSQLDYYTIESVYQYVFYSNNSSSSFPYLDKWCPKKHQNPRRKTDYKILDTVFVGKKKPSVFSKEYLHSFLEDLKAFDFLNSTLALLIDRVRSVVAEDTKEEVEYDAETRLQEVNASWADKFSRGNAELVEIKAELEAQFKKYAELMKTCEELAKENELLKSQISELSAPETEHVVEESGEISQYEVPQDEVLQDEVPQDEAEQESVEESSSESAGRLEFKYDE